MSFHKSDSRTPLAPTEYTVSFFIIFSICKLIIKKNTKYLFKNLSYLFILKSIYLVVMTTINTIINLY